MSDEYKPFAMYDAIRANDVDTVKDLSRNRSKRWVDYNHFIFACEQKRIEIIKLFLEDTFDINMDGGVGVEAAIHSKDIDIVKLVVAIGKINDFHFKNAIRLARRLNLVDIAVFLANERPSIIPPMREW